MLRADSRTSSGVTFVLVVECIPGAILTIPATTIVYDSFVIVGPSITRYGIVIVSLEWMTGLQYVS